MTSRRIAFAVTLLGSAATLVAIYLRLWPFHGAPGDRASQAGIAIGLWSLIATSFTIIPVGPSRWQRRSTAEQVVSARNLIRMREHPYVVAEIDRLRLDDGLPVNGTWLTGERRGNAIWVAEIAEALSGGLCNRLAITGGSGTGKSSLALLLAERILAKKEYAGPVPIIFSLASWDAASFPNVTRWLISEVERRYGFVRSRHYGATAAESLILGGYVMAILDGLDELPKRQRELVFAYIHGLSRAWPVVVTATTLSRRDCGSEMTVIRLSEMPAEAVMKYLTADRAGSGWDISLLTSAAGKSFAKAVRTPLMASLARDVVRAGDDPGALISLKSSNEIRRTLLQRYIPAVYCGLARKTEDISIIDSTVGRRGRPRWRPERAHSWMKLLARQATTDSQRNLEWWQLRRSLGGARVCYPLALLVLMPLAVLLTVALGHGDGGRDLVVWTALTTFNAMAVLSAPALGASLEAPVDVQPRLDMGFGMSTLAAAITAVVSKPYLGLGLSLIAALAAGVVAGMLARSFRIPLATDGKPNVAPWQAQRWLRNSSIAGAVCHATAGYLVLTHLITLTPWAHPLIPALTLAIGLLALRMSAWGTYCAVRVFAAVRRDLPWRLSRFLEDASSLGVLRREGPAYRFRHEMLRAALIEENG